jgi:hypothetical protein
MKSAAPPSNNGALDDGATGLPVLRTWPRVYLFVAGIFVIWVVLLTALALIFS